MSNATTEIESGQRFAFGKNWRSFLSALNDERINEAKKSLLEMLAVDTLQGKSFLDVGSGSGLFSLAARQLGAAVTSFDFDPESVACAEELKRRYFPSDPNWRILQGSALDPDFVRSLGAFDIVYSWGVLHHTGQMWKGLTQVVAPVKPQGRLFIAIYNDQGPLSRFWWIVKKVYCSGLVGKTAMIALFVPYFSARAFCKSLLTGTNRWAEYKRSRGMSLLHDWLDWLGGFPFEVASVEAITRFYQENGFSLVKVVGTRSWGNNQFVFAKL